MQINANLFSNDIYPVEKTNNEFCENKTKKHLQKGQYICSIEEHYLLGCLTETNEDLKLANIETNILLCDIGLAYLLHLIFKKWSLQRY